MLLECFIFYIFSYLGNLNWWIYLENISYYCKMLLDIHLLLLGENLLKTGKNSFVRITFLKSK